MEEWKKKAEKLIKDWKKRRKNVSFRTTMHQIVVKGRRLLCIKKLFMFLLGHSISSAVNSMMMNIDIVITYYFRLAK